MSSTNKKKTITKRLVDSAEPDPAGELRIWDTDIKGFVLRVWPTGRKIYGLKYRFGGRQRWYRIGEHGSPWTVETARDQAKDVLEALRRGEDAQAQKQGRRHAVTVADLIELYRSDGPADRPNKRQSSWDRDWMDMANHVQPLLGSTPLIDLAPVVIAKFQADVALGKTAKSTKLGPRARSIVRGGKGAAGRSVRSLSAMLSWAVRRQIIGANPVLKIEKIKDGSRERFLSGVEIKTLFDTMGAMKKGRAIQGEFVDIITLLLLTGARRSEIVGLQWSEVDLERRLLLLPPERTKVGGRNRIRAIPLAEEAIAILGSRKQTGIHVFQSQLGDQPLQGMSKAWDRVRKRAQMPDLRLHDLRHTFASIALQGGAPLAVIGRALGHRNAASTERYAHLRDDAAFAAAEAVSTNVRQSRSQPPTRAT